MARPREFDEERALTAALETFWEHGYEATSLADLTERMQLQKGSLYGAFGDKRQLYRTALAHYQARGLAAVEEELGGDGSPRAALRRFFAGVVERSASKHGPRGCLCVNTAIELGPHDDEVAESVRTYGERVDALFQALIERGQARREFDPKLDAAGGARFLTTLMYGLAVLAKLHPPRARLEEVVRVGLAALEP